MSTDSTVKTISELSEEYGLDEEAFEIYLNNHHIDKDSAESHIDDFIDSYIGHFSDRDDFVREYMGGEDDLLSGLPSHLRQYFDWDSLGRDLFLGGEVWEDFGHYFRNF